MTATKLNFNEEYCVEVGNEVYPITIRTIKKIGYEDVVIRCVIPPQPNTDLFRLSSKMIEGEVIPIPLTPNTLIRFTNSDSRIRTAHVTILTYKAIKVVNIELGWAWIPINALFNDKVDNEYRVVDDYVIAWVVD